MEIIIKLATSLKGGDSGGVGRSTVPVIAQVKKLH
jgi:hypothetical protein